MAQPHSTTDTNWFSTMDAVREEYTARGGRYTQRYSERRATGYSTKFYCVSNVDLLLEIGMRMGLSCKSVPEMQRWHGGGSVRFYQNGNPTTPEQVEECKRNALQYRRERLQHVVTQNTTGTLRCSIDAIKDNVRRLVGVLEQVAEDGERLLADISAIPDLLDCIDINVVASKVAAKAAQELK